MLILKPIHIIAGLVAITAGAVALYAVKGSTLHRRSGMIFAVAMLTMTSSAVTMAAFLNPNIGNVIAGLLTFYLVSTGLLTMMRSVAQVCYNTTQPSPGKNRSFGQLHDYAKYDIISIH